MFEAIILSSVITNLDIVDSAMNKAGYEEHKIELVVVEPDHHMLVRPGRDREAVAMRYRSGREVILVSRAIDASDRASLIQHEVAHIVAWRKHGERVEEHGRKFKSICRSLVENRASYFCK